jgi:hypothetical protein
MFRLADLADIDVIRNHPTERNAALPSIVLAEAA